MMMLEETFCLVDDFCQMLLPEWEKYLVEHDMKGSSKFCSLCTSEIMTIMILFHQSSMVHFKGFYQDYLSRFFKDAFPGLVSYNRFVELMSSVLLPMAWLSLCLTGEKTGIYFVDSTILKVCHIKREKQHKVFKAIATKGKSSVGWFYGFKLHLVINERGELMAFRLTTGREDDREPVRDLVRGLKGILVGDKGYISTLLSQNLLEQGLHLVTKIRKNMRNKLMTFRDKIALKKRGVIESVNQQLKNNAHIEHTRHRSVWNFTANLLSGLIAYSLRPTKPHVILD